MEIDPEHLLAQPIRSVRFVNVPDGPQPDLIQLDIGLLQLRQTLIDLAMKVVKQKERDGDRRPHCIVAANALIPPGDVDVVSALRVREIEGTPCRIHGALGGNDVRAMLDRRLFRGIARIHTQLSP